MSVASRQRQAERDRVAGRVKPARHTQAEAYQHPPFSVTGFASDAYKATLRVVPAKGQGKVRVKPEPRVAKQLPAWKRDGFVDDQSYRNFHTIIGAEVSS